MAATRVLRRAVELDLLQAPPLGARHEVVEVELERGFPGDD
jgi:hypothetical protein